MTVFIIDIFSEFSAEKVRERKAWEVMSEAAGRVPRGSRSASHSLLLASDVVVGIVASSLTEQGLFLCPLSLSKSTRASEERGENASN